MSIRRISKVGVLGSGLMGSGIAAHLAGCGLSVLLLDREHESEDRNKLVHESLQKCINQKPSNIYHKSFLSRIEIGNFSDNLNKLKTCDWIIEVIIENLEIKKSLYDNVEKYRRNGTLISSNTSGIPIHQLIEGRTEDFKQHFCGTHFFNPPRYLSLLEIIPTLHTKPEVIQFLQNFGTKYLNKQTVVCKDSPAFIANRIGVVSMSKIFELAYELNLSIEDVDKLTGPTLGRPKSGTFRLADVVGLDTAITVWNDLKKNCPDDEMIQSIQMPEYLEFLKKNKWYGNKSEKGFYLRSEKKDSKGKPVFLSLDLHNMEYTESPKSSYESLKISKQIEDLGKRLRTIVQLDDPGSKFIQLYLGNLFCYSSKRVNDIAENLFSIDQAMRSGYAWELGPFEYWDALGFEIGLELIHKSGNKAADWVYHFKNTGFDKFYKVENGTKSYFDLHSNSYQALPNQNNFIRFELLEKKSLIYHNPEFNLWDIGDEVLCAEFHCKHNAIGEGILNGLNESVKIAEEGSWRGLIIGNNAANFTVGANLMLIGMLAFQQEYQQLEMAVRLFQNTAMRLRYSKIPIVMATQGYVFGGGIEFLMHCDAAVCAVESYLGLVEAGVGLIPGGGGSKEFALRFSEESKTGEVLIPQLIEKFKTIAMASVATSAYEGFDYGYLLHTRDEICLNYQSQIQQAKQKVLSLSEHYLPPQEMNNIMVLGRSGLGTLNTAAHTLWRGGFASEHDIKIAKKLAYVLCGGDLSYPQFVSEQYLLDIEREAFLSLCTEPKTLERIQYMLENNKPLRN